jgi:tetratricopeptide (TPR) repeat protein
MAVFNEVRKIRTKAFGLTSPKLAMVLNNIACCNFQMGNHMAALVNLQEARDIQQKVMGSTAKADLDLLHVAVTLCNYGYLQLRLKHYDDARSVFEEALLVRIFVRRRMDCALL